MRKLLGEVFYVRLPLGTRAKVRAEAVRLGIREQDVLRICMCRGLDLAAQERAALKKLAKLGSGG